MIFSVAAILILAGLVVFLLIRALFFVPPSAAPASLPEPSIDIEAAAKHLGEAITFRTIANTDEEKIDWAEFEKFRLWLEKTYPAVHRTLECETVNRASLLYRWKGRDQKLKPFALLAHMDVVPVEEITLGDWTYPPFSGFVGDKEIWGRGASDMKNQLVALFETAETLIKEGYLPERDIYLCIGHNEEVQVGEASGARAMARLLRERGVRLEFVLDEGGAILDDPPFGLSTPVAMIGIAEKGYADFRLTATDDGGHAAEPPPHTALGKLAKAIAVLEKSPMKQRFISPVTLTFDALGRYMSLPMRLVIANLWLFKPLTLRILAKDKQTNAMTRTTIAATMAEASPAPNVLPQRASAILNVRILPGDTADDVLKHITSVTARTGAQIEVELLKDSPALNNPAQKGRSSSQAYKNILYCLNAVNEKIIPSPYIVTGATDSREYEQVADEIYRFYPFLLSSSELAAMHATNERIRRESLAGALRFNYYFVKKAGSQNE